MLCKSSKWELGFVHYNAKFTISGFVISRFECGFSRVVGSPQIVELSQGESKLWSESFLDKERPLMQKVDLTKNLIFRIPT